MHTAAEILNVLDSCCEHYSFPMLDNGYVYLAATRLSLFRTATEWAMVTEVFGFSPRVGLPNINVSTFASTLSARDPVTNYVSEEAHRNYLSNHPHDDARSFEPIEEGAWLDGELVADEPGVSVILRGEPMPAPARSGYGEVGIELQEPERVHVFELCRYLAAVARDKVLATPTERRVSILPDMVQVLQLEEWNHPDLVRDQRPSELETFQQLARVLSTGDVSLYRPSVPPNTHWKNWPEGGSL